MSLFLLWILVGLAGSALCAGAETGYYGLNAVQLRHLARKHSRAALLERAIRSPAGFLAALLIGNNVANSLAVNAGIGLGQELGLGEARASALATLLLTPIVFLLGEVSPKRVLLRRPLPWMLTLAPLLGMLRLLLLPLTAPLAALVRVLGGLPEEGLGRRHLLALLRSGASPREPAVAAAARALESAGRGLRPYLRTDLPRLPAAGSAGAHSRWLAGCPQTLALVHRAGGLPGLLSGARLALLEPGTPATAAVQELPLLDPDLDLSAALGRLRELHAGRALVGRPDSILGVLDLEDLLARLLRSEAPRPETT